MLGTFRLCIVIFGIASDGFTGPLGFVFSSVAFQIANLLSDFLVWPNTLDVREIHVDGGLWHTYLLLWIIWVGS